MRTRTRMHGHMVPYGRRMRHDLKYLLMEIRLESRSKSESSLIVDYLTIQCYAFSVKIDVFSTLSPNLLKKVSFAESLEGRILC